MARFMNLPNDDEVREPKVYKTRKDPLVTMTDEQMRKRFRFDKEGIRFICDLVREDVQHPSKRGGALSVESQVLATLLYMASSTFQLHSGDLLGMDQKSISNSIKRVTKALVAKAGQFIHFSTTEQERRQTIRSFRQVAGFPNVVGLIDCTHIRILAPKNEIERDYVNRKNYHSINVQAIVDEQCRFVNLVAKWPGCTHDSFILRHSQVWEAFEQGQKTGIILGDSGYACRRWLMTPIANPNEESSRRYNSSHSRTRVQIEQVFGRWKRRFHSLHGELRISLENVPSFILAAAVLHNIAVQLRQPDFMGPEDDYEENQPEEIDQNIHGNSGNAYRNQIVLDFFGGQ